MCGHEEDGAGTHPDTFTEIALNITHNMAMETRMAGTDLPPRVTINGRLRLYFDSWETWTVFVASLEDAFVKSRNARHDRRHMDITRHRL